MDTNVTLKQSHSTPPVWPTDYEGKNYFTIKDDSDQYLLVGVENKIRTIDLWNDETGNHSYTDLGNNSIGVLSNCPEPNYQNPLIPKLWANKIYKEININQNNIIKTINGYKLYYSDTNIKNFETFSNWTVATSAGTGTSYDIPNGKSLVEIGFFERANKVWWLIEFWKNTTGQTINGITLRNNFHYKVFNNTDNNSSNLRFIFCFNNQSNEIQDLLFFGDNAGGDNSATTVYLDPTQFTFNFN